ncbi:hypothetical protein FS837_002813 [Tulasnella sp. UAMH 9824]|nr:hypothetical protein FS837_002813 [Tulasnella sp. UAMH 9824]
MSSTLKPSVSGIQHTDVSSLMLNTFYGVQKQTLPHAGPGEVTVMEKFKTVLPSASARLEEIPCPPAGKAAELSTCLLLYEPTEDNPADTILSSLNKYFSAFRWYAASKLINPYDKKRVTDALQQHLSQVTGRESTEKHPTQQLEREENAASVPFAEPDDPQDVPDANITAHDDYMKVGTQVGLERNVTVVNIARRQEGPRLTCETECKSGAADVPQQGETSIVNQTPQYPITECEELAEEDTRFRNGMKKNVEELVQLSEIANRYLQESPPTIDRSTSPSQMFNTISLARRQMKEGMEILEAFKHLRLQRRGLTEQLESKLAVAENWVRAYDGIAVLLDISCKTYN